MKTLTLKAPAKINLYLRLTGKRKDGFNNLVTVFHRLALTDTLTFKKAKRGCKIKTDRKGVPVGPSNLIHRAHKLLKSNGLKEGIEVQLEKKIPMQAGLGGGSSDAAATLMALNRLYKLGLSKSRLCELGGELGSDVPFFITNDRLSLGIDRGEKLLKLEDGGVKFYVVLFIFKQGLSTKNVYENHHYPQRAYPLTKILREAIMLPLSYQARDLSAIAKISYNDLLGPAKRLKPEIFSLIKRLKKEKIPFVQMTGSGATVFCMVPEKKMATNIYRQFSSEKNFSVLITRSY